MLLQRAVWQHAQSDATADAAREVLAVGFLPAVEVEVELRHTGRDLAFEAEIQELLQQARAARQRNRFVVHVHHSRECRPISQHDQHVVELRGTRCLRLREGCVECQSSRSLHSFQERAQRHRANRRPASKRRCSSHSSSRRRRMTLVLPSSRVSTRLGNTSGNGGGACAVWTCARRGPTICCICAAPAVAGATAAWPTC